MSGRPRSRSERDGHVQGDSLKAAALSTESYELPDTLEGVRNDSSHHQRDHTRLVVSCLRGRTSTVRGLRRNGRGYERGSMLDLLGGGMTMPSSLSILVLANNSCDRDARIVRAAEAARSAGHRVTVIGRRESDLPSTQIRNDVTYVRVGGPKGIVARSSALRRLLRLTLGATGWLLLLNARSFTTLGVAVSPDIVHAHDLYTLLAGRRIAKKTGAKLIYDAHELEIGRNGRFGAAEKAITAACERFLIRDTDAVITVSDSIADCLARHYDIPRPIIVHNTPATPAADGRDLPDIRSRLGLGVTDRLAVYIGGITLNRGLEQIVQAMPHMPGVHVAMLGPRMHADTEAAIVAIASGCGVLDRLHLVDPVPFNEVTSFVRTADVSLALIQDACLSYRYSFPNKLLESLFAGLPVVASALPEYERLIARTGAGIAVDQADPRDIARGVRTILCDRAAYTPSPEVLEDLRAHFGWGSQAKRLLELYEKVAGSMPMVRTIP